MSLSRPNTSNSKVLKDGLRIEVKQWLEQLSGPEWFHKANLVLNNLYKVIHHPDFSSTYTGSYFLYASHRKEVPTLNLIQHGFNYSQRQMHLPVICGHELEMVPVETWRQLALNAYDIFEPRQANMSVENRPVNHVPETSFKWGLIPGLLFNEKGHRLGHGRGFYDRFLKRISKECLTIGIGFKINTTHTIPQEEWDEPVNIFVHDQGIDLADVTRHPFFRHPFFYEFLKEKK